MWLRSFANCVRAQPLLTLTLRAHTARRTLTSVSPPTGVSSSKATASAGAAPGTVTVVDLPEPAAPMRWAPRPATLGQSGKLVPQVQFERGAGGASPPPQDDDAPNAPFNWRRHAVTLGACLLLSAQLGVAFTWGNEASRLVGIEGECDLHFERLLSNDIDDTNLVELVCERLSRASAYNDDVCRRVAARPDVCTRLCALLAASPPVHVTRDCKINAAKVLENVCALTEVRAPLVARGDHTQLLDVLRAPHTSLIVRKSLAAALASLCEIDANIPALVAAGAVSALHATQVNEKLRRQRTDVVLQEMCAWLCGAGTATQVPPSEAALVKTYADAHARAATEPLHSIRSPLIKSGLLLYLHTIAGGAAWGIGSALYHGQPWLGPAVRTALVTGLVPAFFVGGIVSLFQRYQREANTEQDVFRLYATTMFATMWPAFYIMPVVDRWAPLWIGGHVVGFGSFFVYLWLSDSDLMKNDQALLNEDQPLPALADMMKRLRHARIEAKLKHEQERSSAAKSDASATSGHKTV